MKRGNPPLPVPSQENEEDFASVPAVGGTKDKGKGDVGRGRKNAGGKEIQYCTTVSCKVSLYQVLFSVHNIICL